MPAARQSTVATIALSVLLGGCLGSVVEPPSPHPVAAVSPTPLASAVDALPTVGPPRVDSATSSAEVATVVTCPTEPATLETLIGLRLDGGPLSVRYDVRLNEHALDCLKETTLTFTAFVASPEGLGGVVAYQVTPSWLDTWSDGATYLAASDREAAPGAPVGPFLPVAVPPDLRPAFDAQRRHWVEVSGQLGSPAAQGCVASPDSGPDVPSPADLVEMCRTGFVIGSIAAAADPCPARVTLQALIATREDSRADCFGGGPIAFTAAGSMINNVWPGLTLPPGYRDWIFGGDHLAFDDQALAVFVPDAIPLPDPAGTPWAHRDLVGGPDTVWKVTGHFDHDFGDTCVPDEGYTLETPGQGATQVVVSKGEAASFCRNHFVVDRLIWLPHATAPD